MVFNQLYFYSLKRLNDSDIGFTTYTNIYARSKHRCPDKENAKKASKYITVFPLINYQIKHTKE